MGHPGGLTINPANTRSRQGRGQPSVVSIALSLPHRSAGDATRDFPAPRPSGELQTAELQAVIDDCALAGGGRVVLGRGVYRAGTLVLRSGVTLHLERGATLLASEAIADYRPKETPLEGRLLGGIATALIFAENAANLAITGEGTIDGSGRSFFEPRRAPLAWVEERRHMGLWIPGFDVVSRPRPRALVLLVGCTGVRLSGVRLTASPSWMVHLLACSNVHVAEVTIRGLIDGANTDGIDLDGCSDVVIEDCDIETGDDAIALKNTNSWGLKRPSRRIAVRHCRLASTTHGFTIGTETQDDFEDVTVVDSTIEGTGAHRVLTGLGLDVVDGGSVRRVRVANVSISDCVAAVHLRLGNAGRGQAVRTPGSIRDVALENLVIRRAAGNCLISGLPGQPLRDIALRNVQLEFSDRVDALSAARALPEMDGEFPPNAAWRLLPAYGLYGRHVQGLDLVNVAIVNCTADLRPALLLEDVSGEGVRDVRVLDT